MDRAFQYSLRTALVLCILAGVGLIVYSVLNPGPTRARVENMPALPPATGSAITVPSAGNGPAAGSPATPAPQTASTGPAQQAAAAPGPASPEISMREWIYKFTNQQTQRQEGVISGQQAVFKGDNAVDIVKPLLVLLGQGDVDVDLGEVHITAQSGSVDKSKGLVRLFTGVTADGRDFSIHADHVLYNASDHTMTSDGPVDIVRYNVAADGTKTPAMTLSGQGIEVNTDLNTMRILSHPVAHIIKVSKDFLAVGTDAQPLPLEPMDVTVTSDGPMTYLHKDRKVTFTKNVKAVYGPRTLTGDELTVELGDVEGKRDPVVSRILAVGNVTLTYQDQVARGQRLEWQIVTQSATLEGDTCEVASPEFRLVGQTLVLYRLTSRFDVKGPGALYWGPPAVADPPQPAAAPSAAAGSKLLGPRALGPWAAAAAAPVGILTLSKDNKVTVTWQTSMSYDVPARYATFAGGVVAQQTDSSLKCDQLKINFRQESSDIDSVVATGNVSVRDVNATSGRDILCQELTWNAGADTIELTAVKGQTVTITQGPQTVSSSHLVLDNAQGALDCPAPGRLTMAPAGAQEGAAPVTVSWQQSMHFTQRPAPQASFNGGVVAQRGDESLKADSLGIDFDAKMNPLKVTALKGADIEVRSNSALFPSASSAAPSAPAVPAAVAAATGDGSFWRLSGDSITIEPPSQTISSDAPGTLSVLQHGSSAGTISWQKQMRLDSVKSEAQFEGGVDAQMPAGTLKCDRLTVTFEVIDGVRQLRHGRAEGNVRFESTEQNPWRLKSAVADAIFGPASALRQIIARGDDTHMVEASGRYGDETAGQSSTVTSRRLTLSLDTAAGEGNPSISRAVAEEDVTVTYATQPPVQGTGDKLEWDRSTDTYTLTGEPVARVVRGALVTSSRKINLNRRTGATTGTPGE